MLRIAPVTVFALAASALVVAIGACDSPVALGGFQEEPDATTPSLTPSDGGVPEADANAFAPLCAATECVAPYGTCPGDSYRCQTDFDTDNANCGGCGIVCPNGGAGRTLFGADWFCQAGKCRMTCVADETSTKGDCNNDVADGCETDLSCDSNNCGGCGIKCPPGLTCAQGNCGCPAGLTACGTGTCGSQCTDLATDVTNCGACGNRCPDDNTPVPPNMEHGCGDSKCDQLACSQGFADCDGDATKTPSDGCEVNLATDPANCGACKTACGPNQTCQDGKCICAPNETMCMDIYGDVYCADLNTSPGDCGACGAYCPFTSGAGSYTCRLGHCELECPSGTADCDGVPDNGCETRVDADPRNCGGCGAQCDLSIGQPCVQGQCLMTPCGEGPTR